MSKKPLPVRKAQPAPRQNKYLPWVGLAIALIIVVAGVYLSSRPSAPQSNPGAAATAVANIQATNEANPNQLAPTPTPYPLPPEIPVNEAVVRYQEGAFMLDVREPDEWIAGHIPDATLIPLGQLAQRLKELDPNREIVVVCRSGNRSATGRDILLDAGFKYVTSMAGGMNQWTAAGYPTVTGK